MAEEMPTQLDYAPPMQPDDRTEWTAWDVGRVLLYGLLLYLIVGGVFAILELLSQFP